MWGYLTDGISATFLAAWLFYGLAVEESSPDFLDSNIADRYWAALFSRIICPIGFLWYFGIAVGGSFTSWLFSSKLILNRLAPAAYNMFLFHQPVSEVYYRATRGEWWAYPKNFYWFSPEPFPVYGWEVPIVMGIVIAFSVFMETFVNEWLVSQCASLLNFWAKSTHKDDSLSRSVNDTICALLIDVLNQPNVTPDMGLVEVGMSSMTTIIVVSEIKKLYKVSLSVRDCYDSETVGDLVALIEGRLDKLKEAGQSLQPEKSLLVSDSFGRDDVRKASASFLVGAERRVSSMISPALLTTAIKDLRLEIDFSLDEDEEEDEGMGP
jgi:acyl carrier protein